MTLQRVGALLPLLLVAGSVSCYPVMGRAWVPGAIGDPPPASLLASPKSLMILPVWRGGEGYFLEDPVFLPAEQLGSVPKALDRPWYVGFMLYFHEYHGLHRDARHLFVISDTGRVLRLKNHRDWLVTHEACMGSRWRDELSQQLSSGHDLSLLPRNGLEREFWGFASSEAFTDDIRTCAEPLPDASPDLQSLHTRICNDQRLRIDYSRRVRRRLVEFLDSVVLCSDNSQTDRWSLVQALPLIPDY
jgi:hypothetical protein